MTKKALLQARDALSEALAAVDVALGQDAPPIDRFDLLEVGEAAEIAGVRPPTIRKWVSDRCRGEVEDWIGYRIGGRVYLSRSRFLRHLTGRRLASLTGAR